MSVIDPPAPAPVAHGHAHAGPGHDANGHHAHPPHLAHHFDTPEQQFDSAKVGMWVFLATEILMFGGLFCAYAIFRYNNPNVFRYSEHHLNTTLGALNTVILLASSLTMALAVRAAQLGQQKYLVLMLAMTLLGGFGFLCIKTVEYYEKWDHGLFPGRFNVYDRINNEERFVEYMMKYGGLAAVERADGPAGVGEVAGGSQMTAAEAEGGVAPSQRATGRQAVDDPRLGEVPGPAATQADPDVETTPSVGQQEGLIPEAGDPQLPPTRAPLETAPPRPGLSYVDPHAATSDRVQVRPAFNQPQGLATVERHAYHRVEFLDLSVREQSNVRAFFSIYFMMTGLHVVHVIIGMGLIVWVLVKSLGGLFGPAYFTPVDLTGLYWHLVDLIWIFLFPLLYLIH